MEIIVEIILESGKSAINLVLYLLMPVMVVMMAMMKLLETKGVLAGAARILSPMLNRLGIPGIGVFAILQLLFVSFAAPVATFCMMENDRIAKPKIAATLAMVLTMSQANVIFPMVTVGLNFWVIIGSSLIGGIIASKLAFNFAKYSHSAEDIDPHSPPVQRIEVNPKKTAKYKITWLTLKILKMERVPHEVIKKVESIRGHTVLGTERFLRLLDEETDSELVDRYKALICKHAEIGAINLLVSGGQEGVQIVLKSIPILILAIFFVNVFDESGIIAYFGTILSPFLNQIDLPGITVLPFATKYLAGGTAMMGVTLNLINEGTFTALDLNRTAGFIINPFDLVGVAVFISAGPRVASALKPAVLGTLVGLFVRGIIHLVFPWNLLV